MVSRVDSGEPGRDGEVMLEILEAIRSDIDARLTRAVRDRDSPMHTPVVATADADARIMVLRDFQPATGILRFHTDIRAPKAKVIGDGGPVGVLFYDKAAKLQIRCRGTGEIVGSGPLVDAAWAASTRFARRCYLGEGPGAPSSVPTSGVPAEFEGHEPEEAALVPARKNFAVLLVTIASLDWFHLAHTGHRRAIFEHGDGRWVAP